MYAFELAAEFKARSERNLVLVTSASVRSIYHISVTSYKILYDVLVKTFQEKKPQTNRKYRVGQRRPADPTQVDDDAEFDENDIDAQQQQSTTSRQHQTTRKPYNNNNNNNRTIQQQHQTGGSSVPSTALDADEKTLEEFRLFQQMLAQRQLPTATTTAPTTPSVTKQSKPTGPIPKAPYLPGFIGEDGNIIPETVSWRPTAPATTTPATSTIAKPPQQQNNKPPGGLDFSELKNRPLRSVKDSQEQRPPPPSTTAPGGIDLSELKRRPLRSVSQSETNKDTSSSSQPENKFPTLRPVNKNQPPPVQPQLVRGKRVESSSIPGEENMSFSDRIKVASKMTLKQTHGPRSPGGTPRRERQEKETEFMIALRRKFKNVNRESIHEDENSEIEW